MTVALARISNLFLEIKMVDSYFRGVSETLCWQFDISTWKTRENLTSNYLCTKNRLKRRLFFGMYNLQVVADFYRRFQM